MPALQPVTFQGYRCTRCAHVWIPKRPDRPPRVCPGCSSPYWDTRRVRYKPTTAKT